MRITFVNVGYGDAILMESDTGYTALLDGGGNLPQEKYDPKTDHKIYDPKALTKDKITKEEYRRCRKPIGIGSLVGVIIGATPGTGGGLAAFIAYGKYFKSKKNTLLFAFSHSIPLTFLVATAQLGKQFNAISTEEYYAFILAALLEGIVFMVCIKLIYQLPNKKSPTS